VFLGANIAGKDQLDETQARIIFLLMTQQMSFKAKNKNITDSFMFEFVSFS
jgi:hypothetical protein